MLLFVSEYVTGGAWTEPEQPASLVREGLAMLGSLAWDFAQIPDCQVVTTWSSRLGACPLLHEETDRISVRIVDSPDEERQAFGELCLEADASLIIAPEFQNLLASRCQAVRDLGATLLNCSVEAIQECTDKLRLAEKLAAHKIPTIPTQPLTDPFTLWENQPKLPFVVKPRDGAGSQDTFLIGKEEDWRRFLSVWETRAHRSEWIWQPHLPGRTLSVAAVIGELQWNGQPWLEVFPIAEQQFSRDGRFTYQGGRIPDSMTKQHAATQRVRDVVKLIPGLFGYIGIDLLPVPNDPEDLLIVEINPRLTTSYLGYRELADQSLAEYFLPKRPQTPLRWKPQVVQFTADGRITRNPRRTGKSPA